jgi:hypothetical protein
LLSSRSRVSQTEILPLAWVYTILLWAVSTKAIVKLKISNVVFINWAAYRNSASRTFVMELDFLLWVRLQMLPSFKSNISQE